MQRLELLFDQSRCVPTSHTACTAVCTAWTAAQLCGASRRACAEVTAAALRRFDRTAGSDLHVQRPAAARGRRCGGGRPTARPEPARGLGRQAVLGLAHVSATTLNKRGD